MIGRDYSVGTDKDALTSTWIRALAGTRGNGDWIRDGR